MYNYLQLCWHDWQISLGWLSVTSTVEFKQNSRGRRRQRRQNNKTNYYHITRADPLTPSYIIWPASWRERVRTGWRERVRKKPSGPASIFLLCLHFFKYNERYKWAQRKASFTILKNLQMPSYWNKHILLKHWLRVKSQQQTSTVLDVRSTMYDMNVF